MSGGSQPFSEPETQALRDYFLLTQPVAVILWDGTTADFGRVSPCGCGETSLFSDWLAMKFSRETAYNQEGVASKDTGDAANWLDAQGFSVIRVRLPYLDIDTREESKTALVDNVRAIREIMNYFKSSQSPVLPIIPILPLRPPGGGGTNYDNLTP